MFIENIIIKIIILQTSQWHKFPDYIVYNRFKNVCVYYEIKEDKHFISKCAIKFVQSEIYLKKSFHILMVNCGILWVKNFKKDGEMIFKSVFNM